MASHGSDVAAGRHAACAGDAQRKDERHTESEALHQLKRHPRVVAAFESNRFPLSNPAPGFLHFRGAATRSAERVRVAAVCRVWLRVYGHTSLWVLFIYPAD